LSYEHSCTPCAPILYDYYDSYDHDVDTSSLLSRAHRLEALASFNREIYLQNLLKTDLSLDSSTPKASSCDDFDVRSEALIPLGHDFYDDTHSKTLRFRVIPHHLLHLPLRLELLWTPLRTF